MENQLQYLRCKTAVLDYIAQHELGIGSCLPAQRKLCGLLGFSIITVRRALFELEQTGVIEARRGKGVFVLQTLEKGRKNGRILFLDINAPFREIDTGLRYLLQYVSKRGYEFRTISTGPSPDHFLLEEIGEASGLIVTGVITADWRCLLQSCSCPIVNIGERKTHFKGVRTVYVDDLGAIRQAIDYFRERGCSRFAFLNTGREYFRTDSYHLAFKNGLERRHLAYCGDWEAYVGDEGRYNLVCDFLQKHDGEFDCILCESGIAPSLMACCYEYGYHRVPVGVIGGGWNYFRSDNKLITLFGVKNSVFHNAADMLIDAMGKREKVLSDEVVRIRTEIIQ